MFVFNDLQDFAKWLDKQADAKKAESRASKKQVDEAFAAGEGHGYRVLANLINNGSITFKQEG